jgi:hypothetical protein
MIFFKFNVLYLISDETLWQGEEKKQIVRKLTETGFKDKHIFFFTKSGVQSLAK